MVTTFPFTLNRFVLGHAVLLMGATVWIGGERAVQEESLNAGSPRSDGYGTLNAMNCKIERIVNGQGLVVLRVSGRIDEEHVGTLREMIAQEHARVALDLTEVILADREAVRLLAVSETNGVELRNCPPYIREWVTKEKDIGYGERI